MKTIYSSIIYLSLLLFAVVPTQQGDPPAVINYVSVDSLNQGDTYRVGSLLGGNKLYIRGSGLPTDYIDTSIKVGDKECDIDLSICSPIQLGCTVPPSSASGDFPVSITIKDVIATCPPAICRYTYNALYTPVFQFIVPAAVTPNNPIKVGGIMRVERTSLLQINLGNFFCNSDVYGDQGLLPNDFSWSKCQVDALPPGYYLANVKTSTKGKALEALSVPVIPDGTYQPYDFMVAPEITKLSSNSGPKQGDDILITGKGFSTNPLKNVVTYEGHPCTVSESTSTTIKCTILNTPTLTLNVPRAGHAGVLQRIFAAKNSFDELRKTPEFVSGTGGLVRLLTFETPFDDRGDYSQSMETLFKAPVTGSYRFLLSANRPAELYISTTPLSKTNLVKIAQVDSGTGFREFFDPEEPKQVSDPVNLEAGKYYFLQALHLAQGVDHLTVGVRIPNSKKSNFNPKEVVSVKIAAQVQRLEAILTLKKSTDNLQIIYVNGNAVKSSSAFKYPANAQTIVTALAAVGIDAQVLSQTYLGFDDQPAAVAQAIKTQYRVRFFTAPTITLPGLNLVNLGGFVKATDVVPTSLVSGSFDLLLAGKRISLKFDATTADVENGFNDALGIPFATRVFRYGRPEDGSQYVIYFNGKVDDVPEITLASNSLQGGRSDVTVNIQVLQDANSNDSLFAPIPSDLLYTFEQNPQITVRTNDVLAVCSGNCNYQPATPAPVPTCRTITGYTLSGSTLEIEFINTGDRVAADFTSISFGGNTLVTPTGCSFDKTTQKLKCNLPLNPNGSPKIIANLSPPLVKINGVLSCTATEVKGIPIYPLVYDLKTQEIANGFLEFTAIGSGYGKDITQVKIGGVSCPITFVNNTLIKCGMSVAVTNGPFTVTVNGLRFDYPFKFEKEEITADLTNDCYIDLIGTAFTTKTVVKLQNDKTGYLERCRSCIRNSTLIRCETCGLPPGDYTALLSTPISSTQSNQASTPFKVVYEVNSVEPKFGSVLGGTVLTLKGKGFSETLNKNQVSVGWKNGGKLLRCHILESSHTQLKCLINENNVGLTGAQDVFPIIGLEFEANCVGDCSFTFSEQYTPTITSVSTKTIKAGDQITFDGTLFSQNTEIRFNGLLSSIIQVSSNQITVRVPDITADATVSFSATDPNYGYYLVDKSIVFSSPLTFTDFTPKSGWRGGAYIKIKGTGFSDGAQVSVGGKACEIAKITAVEITCKTPYNTAGAVTVSQNTFNQIGCTGCTPSTYSLLSTTAPVVTEVVPTQSSGSLQIAFKVNPINVGSPLVVTLKSSAINQQATTLGLNNNLVTAVFNNPIPGSYSLEVRLGDHVAEYLGPKIDVKFTQVVPAQKTIVSRGGGSDLTLSFDGVSLPQDPSLMTVLLGGFNCPINYIGSNYLVCTIPPLITSSFRDLAKEVVFVKPLLTSVATDKPNLAFDGSTSTSFTGSVNNCFIGIDVGRDLVAELTEVRFFPKVGTDVSRLQYSVLEGSNDGVTYTIFTTLSDNIYEGYNTISFAPGARPVYRYFRFRQANALSRCELAELRFKGIELSSISTPDPSVVSISRAFVTINQLTLETITDIEYRSDRTPTVSSISPKLGTSVGGTAVSISGTNFGNSIDKVQIFIDRTECKVSSVTSAKILCTTGALPEVKDRTERLTGLIEVKIKDSGSAVVAKNVNFLYAERWSDSKTWGCDGPPVSGDSVHVPIGMNLFVDIDMPRLVAVVVEGGLIFDDWDIDLHLEYLMIRNGLLRIGTEDQPITSQINITLYGDRDDKQLPIFGNKAIAVYEGVVDIHGIERAVVDTRLVSTANVGDTVINVENADSFKAGDVIVISSTSNDPMQNEKKTIQSKSGNALTLDSPLVYGHLAEKEEFNVGGSNPQNVEIKAIVALLTRNIVIQGDETSETSKYGAHMMFYDPGTEKTIIRISYAEIRNMGQAGYAERNPVNFENTGNQMQSYIVGCSIHTTYNRGIQIKNTQYLTVKKNVLYNTENEAIILPDGFEKMNVIEDNVIVQVTASLFRFNSYRDPGAIKLSNPLNFLRRNKVGGVVRNGFTLVFNGNSQGATTSRAICPQGEKLGAFEDNYVLSCGSVGLFIDSYFPRTYACRSYRDNIANPFANNLPIPAIYKNFFAARTQIGLRAWRLGSVVFDRFKLADSQVGAIEIRHVQYAPLNSSQVTNALIVGNLKLSTGNLALRQYWGVLVPSNDGFTIDSTTFAHFDTTSMALQACSNCANPWEDTGSRVTLLKNLKFFDVAKKVDFTVPYTHIFRDLDGTLTSLPGGGTVVYNLPHLRVPECQFSTEMPGLVCDSRVEVKGINFWNLMPGYMREKQMRILRVKQDVNSDLASSSDFTYTMYRYPKAGYSAPFVTGYAYQVSIDIALDFDSLLLENSPYSFAGDLPITLVFNYTEPREDYDVIRKVYLAADNNLTSLSTGVDVFSPEGIQFIGSKSFGDFYNDLIAKDFFFVITGNSVGNPILDGPDVTKAQVNAFRCKLNCAQAITSNPTVLRSWSDPTGWPGGILPRAGSNVIINANELVTLDMDTPPLDTLEIQGKLVFTSTRESTILTAKKIWVRGRLEAGTSAVPFGSEAIIRLTGTRIDEPIVVNAAVDVGTKVLVVTGELSLVGKQVTTLVRLVQSVDVGATDIKVSGDITSFKVGDQIVIAPSSEEYSESEVRTIQAIDYATNIITLDQSLQYFHYGSNSLYTSTNGVTIDYRTEVLLLKRYIRVEGTTDDGLGARILVTDEYGGPTVKTGNLNIQYASLSFCGQASTDRAGLTFEVATNPKARSVIFGSVFQNCVGFAVRFEKSQLITFENNLIYNTQHYGIKFHGGNKDIKILNNVVLHIKSGPRPPIADLHSFSGGIVMYDETNIDILISQNIVAGCSFSCYLLSAPLCRTTNFFSKNIGHSGKFGYIAYGDLKACINISEFSAYRTRYGIISNYRTSEIQVSKVFLTDNTYSLNLHSSADESRKYVITDSFFAGVSLLDCPKCYSNPNQCSGKSAFALGSFTNDTIPDKFQFYRSNRKLVLDSSFDLQLNYFENFQDNLYPSCLGNKVFYFSDRAIDLVPYVVVRRSFIKRINSPSLAWFSPALVDDFNCGPEEQCTLVYNTLIEDKDGSLVNTPAKPGSILPNNKGVIDSKKCKFYQDANGHVCEGSNYALLGFKNLETSKSLLVLSPVEISNSNGFSNLINSHRNNNPRHPGDTQKYVSIVQTNTNYNLTFPRDVPTKLQFELQGAESNEYVIIKIQYRTRNVISVTNSISGAVLDPSIALPGTVAAIKPENPCGTYIFDREGSSIQFKMTGESTCRLVLEQTNTLVADIRFDITLDEFFDQGGVAPFIDKVAAVLDIPSLKIRIVEIYQGSVGIVFAVNAESQGDNSSEAASEELQKLSTDLRRSVAEGRLNLYNARVLSFDQEIILTENVEEKSSVSPGLIAGISVGVGVLIVGAAYVIYRIKKSKKSRNVVKIGNKQAEKMNENDQKDEIISQKANRMMSVNESKRNLASETESMGSLSNVDETNKVTPSNRDAPKSLNLPSIPEQSNKRRMSIEEKIEDNSSTN